LLFFKYQHIVPPPYHTPLYFVDISIVAQFNIMVKPGKIRLD